MATGKKSVITYVDWGDTYEKLSDEEAGRLIKHFFSYVKDRDPKAPDRLTELLFEPMKLQMKRDLVKWESKSGKRSEIGRIGGLKSAEKRKHQSQPIALKPEPIASKTQANEPVTVTVNDNVTDTVNEKKKEKIKSVISSEVLKLRGDCKKIFLSTYKEKFGTEFYWKPKDAVAMNQLIDQIKFKIKEKVPQKEKVDDKDVVSGFKHILIGVKDTWVLSNFNLPIINSKFNEIFTQIKSGNHGKQSTAEERNEGRANLGKMASAIVQNSFGPKD